MSSQSATQASVVAALRSAGCVFAEDEARLLTAAAPTAAALDNMVAQRASGMPLEHVIGWAEFCGLRLAVEPGVFVPRRRTEYLVGLALVAARAAGSRPVVVDLCCGSGAIGAALVAALDDAQLYAADIDPAAVQCARRNLAGTDAVVSEGDLYEALPATLRGRVDVLVANVPYVPSDAIAFLPVEARLHEPLLALDGGADGLDALRRVAATAALWLAPAGQLLVETSGEQAPKAAESFQRAGMTARVEASDELNATVVIGTKPV